MVVFLINSAKKIGIDLIPTKFKNKNNNNIQNDNIN